MPDKLIITANQAEKLLLKEGFLLIRSRGSHRIYKKSAVRVVIPFHSGRNLHPKVVKQLMKSIEES
ncbi:MAG: type II toxin-antitoxin system HicA family toxin [bacterium]|nr:type II toxin-antitoxin system HicA family toxin [bacterium]